MYIPNIGIFTNLTEVILFTHKILSTIHRINIIFRVIKLTDFSTIQTSTIQSVFSKSNLGEIHFAEVIQQLIAIDVESYFVDYRCGETTYYFPNGKYIRHTFTTDVDKIADFFDADQVKQAILGAQSGQIMYPQFQELTYLAGCIGYYVWIKGKNVQYIGRLGEAHTEKFPQ